MRKILYLVLILLLFSSAGCYNLRKKFIRKNVKPMDEAVYVDFKDYSAYSDDSLLYPDYALFFRAWLDEAVRTLDVTVNRKRVKRSLREALDDIDAMIGLCSVPGQAILQPLRNDLAIISEDFINDRALNDISRERFLIRLKRVKDKFDADCRYSQMKGYLK